jgi:hypothetical protein
MINLNLTGTGVYSNYSDMNISIRAGITFVISGNRTSTTVVGQSPALTVTSGNVVVTGITLTTATGSPAILVQGGSLQLRGDSVQQTSGGTAPAIVVQSGSIDLATAASPGGNTINVTGTGPWVANQTTTPVLPVGDTFQVAGVTQTAPQAFAGSYTLPENGTLSVPSLGVLANDLDPSGKSLTAVLASGPAHGTLVLRADGSFTYTPNANFAGTDSFTYQAKNTDGALSNPATVTLNVQVVASQLVLTGLPSSTNLGVPQAFTVTAEDSSGRVATGYAGTIHFTSTDQAAVLPADYTFTSADNGSHTFTPGVSLASPGSRVITATDSIITGTATVFVNPHTVTWVNSAGGDWGTASNWSTGAVPGPTDAAVINLGANTFTVTHAAGADSVYSLTSQDAISFTAGSLSFSSASAINNTLTVSGGASGIRFANRGLLDGW